jgi:ribosomal protein S18 acetylase RimI-like enzyme
VVAGDFRAAAVDGFLNDQTLDRLPPIEIIVARSARELDAVRVLFAEYAAQLGVDLAFQRFDEELAALPGEYGEPRGTLLLALVDAQVAGCCALRPIDDVDYGNAAEMKRLFVRKAFRGFGLGRQLAEAALEAGARMGYACVLLDTLVDMEAARALYEDLGFEEIPPYYHNPLPGAHYLKADLA